MERPFKYPDLQRIVKTYLPQRLLSRELVWEAKLDGSNLMIWLDTEEDKIRISSRNMDDADSSFQRRFKECSQGSLVEELIRDERRQYNKDLVVFGEMLFKGKSPTRIIVHPEDRFVVFDIYQLNGEQWYNYVAKSQKCYHYNIPVVEAIATSNINNLEDLLKFRDEMLEIVLKKNEEEGTGYEGLVLKTQYKDRVTAKEKIDTPKLEKLPRLKTGGDPALPPLPESEIWGAVDKVLIDLGEEQFMDVKIAMPLVAKYIAEEANKHMCNRPRNMFHYYKSKCEELLTNAYRSKEERTE